MQRYLFALIVLIASVVAGCSKEGFTNSSNARLNTSVDTLHFDTVFTTTGSTSQFIKIINNNDEGIRISSIRLAGGAASPFKINVDGIPGPQVSGTEVRANDSTYIFVTVSINPNATNLPFLVQDSIEISYNGNRQWVQLEAYGLNAHFFRGRTITANETWTAGKPYVILDGLAVAPNATLTIDPGCRIFVHADAPLLIQGRLLVNGGKDDSTRVIFTGDRLDEPYRFFPAGFPGLIFTETSTGNVLNYAIIRNAYQGIVAVDPGAGTKLTLNETIVENAYDAGILGINTSIRARNVLVSNCGKSLMLVKGGDYQFTHCTVTAISTNYQQHKDPVLLLTDYINQNNAPVTSPLNALFTNCIFWGESGGFVEKEVVLAKKGQAFNAQFNNVLWSVSSTPALATVSGNQLLNQNPRFDTISVSDRTYRYHLKSGSPAIDKGSNAGVSIDLDGRPRPVGLPDLGAYEKQ